MCRQNTKAVYKTALTGALKYKSQQIKIALRHKIKFGKSVLKASHSWRRRNNIIRKQIPHINNTITKITVCFGNNVTVS